MTRRYEKNGAGDEFQRLSMSPHTIQVYCKNKWMPVDKLMFRLRQTRRVATKEFDVGEKVFNGNVSKIYEIKDNGDVQFCEHHMHAKDAASLLGILSSNHIIPAIIYMDSKTHHIGKTPLIVEATSEFLSFLRASTWDVDQWKDTTVSIFKLFKRIAQCDMLYVAFESSHLSKANDDTFRLWNFDVSKVLHMPGNESDVDMWRMCAFYTMVWRFLISISMTVEVGVGWALGLKMRKVYDKDGVISFMGSLRRIFNDRGFVEDTMKSNLQRMVCKIHNGDDTVRMHSVFNQSCTVAVPSWTLGNARLFGYGKHGSGTLDIIPDENLPEKEPHTVVDIVSGPKWSIDVKYVKIYETGDRATTTVTDDATTPDDDDISSIAP
jgi:hypothetical protein